MGVSRRLKDKENPEWLAIKWTTPSNLDIIEKAHFESLRGGNITNINTKPCTYSELSAYGDTMALKSRTRGGMTTSIVNLEDLANTLNERMKNKSGGGNQRLAIMLGMLTKDKEEPIKANIPSYDKSMFSMEKYKFFLNAPFEISSKCCNVMKKNPAHKYHKDTGRVPITAQMASESRLRTQKWLQNSCNGFNLRIPTSNPMSFWTEQDVLLYIKTRGMKICSVYGDVVSDDEESGQMTLADWTGQELFELGNKGLHCTGCSRTGCCLCCFGATSRGDDRFLRLKETHAGMYSLLDKIENNGVTYRQAIEWTNEQLAGKGHIYL